MKVSVAMATYNGERYIRQQLDSLARQTLQPYELVICDDGSQDNTLNIVKDFSKSSGFPVHIFENHVNLGYADNFIKAASLCSGEWVAFCDQDDVWLDEKIEKICLRVKEKNDNEIKLVIHSAFLTDGDLNLSGKLYPEVKATDVREGENNSVWFTPPGFTQFFKNDLLGARDWSARPRDFQKPDSKLAHDQLVYMLAHSSGKIMYVAEPLAYHRRHSNTVTPAEKVKKEKIFRKLGKWLTPFKEDCYQNYSCFSSYEAFLRSLGLVRGAEYFHAYANAFKKRYECYSAPPLVRFFFIIKRMTRKDYEKIDRKGSWVKPFSKDLLISIFMRRM